jgi:predicted Rossmann-fold nucleotide-binding protein
MDEAYEALTLVQTGKSSMVPVIMLEGRRRRLLAAVGGVGRARA